MKRKFCPCNFDTFFRLFHSAVLCFFLTAFFNIAGFSQDGKLSLADILTGLRSKKVTLSERNKLLTAAVKSRGITFTVTDEITKELESTGADKILIQAIKEKMPAKPAAAEPQKPSVVEPEYAGFQKQGDSFLIKGDYDLAIANYAKAIELNPKIAELYFGRAMSYYNKGIYASAIADFTSGLELSPKETIAYLNRGDSFEKSGNLQKASADYQKVLELAPGNERAKLSAQRVKTEIAKAEQIKAEQIKAEQIKAEQAKQISQPLPPSKSETVTMQKVSDSGKELKRKEKENKSSDDSAKEKKSADNETSRENTAASQIAKRDLGQITSDKAVRLVQPVYSDEARKFRVGGQVKVVVDLDENGKVLSAKAVSGPTLLRLAAEKAAMNSSVNPEKINLSGRATGFIIYNFKLD